MSLAARRALVLGGTGDIGSAIAAKLEGFTVVVLAKAGENGKIFGSINSIAISEALKAQGIEIDRKSIKIVEEPIKEVGTYEAIANLHKSVKQSFQFEVKGE